LIVLNYLVKCYEHFHFLKLLLGHMLYENFKGKKSSINSELPQITMFLKNTIWTLGVNSLGANMSILVILIQILEIIQNLWSTWNSWKQCLNERRGHQNCASNKPICNNFEWILILQEGNLSELGGNLKATKSSICTQIHVTSPLVVDIISLCSFYVPKSRQISIYLILCTVK